MRTLLPAVLLLAGFAQPAMATGTITCTDPAGDATMTLSVGTLSVLSILRAEITIGEESWSTDPVIAPGTLIVAGQGFETEDGLWASFTDEAVNDIVGELRLAKASEGRDFVMAGTLAMPGVGAYAMVCEGP
ncbi:hypothetical protein EMQ25_06815 [Arsenicitalea aurantiaca]|uniref:Uncharacterized protein n=1 Tax=Arsenicitalea aurantiaca TaxID=1783274 RepID=A0A433XFI2_9HYPH|nr:hypothetical protein [Arsenicitalea aurantiaca]RUT32845.1 hypothetical protein EMQ25_06815 [Arsenicitalea aurantiaca]